jgi:pimeloyl-ACP methyl ester carboxylesterase
LANAINHFGPATAIVGHSFGAAAAVLAISEGARVGRAVLIAPPADVIAATERFVRLFLLLTGANSPNGAMSLTCRECASTHCRTRETSWAETFQSRSLWQVTLEVRRETGKE